MLTGEWECEDEEGHGDFLFYTFVYFNILTMYIFFT